MVAVQLNPQLHQAVHKLKRVKQYGNESMSFPQTEVSKEERAAMTRVFGRDAGIKQQLSKWG